MTLKCNQGHWKLYEWVKLNEYYHHAKFDIYYIYSQRKLQRKRFCHTQTLSWPNTDYYRLTFFKRVKEQCLTFRVLYDNGAVLQKGHQQTGGLGRAGCFQRQWRRLFGNACKNNRWPAQSISQQRSSKGWLLLCQRLVRVIFDPIRLGNLHHSNQTSSPKVASFCRVDKRK